jgi:hypothetical protein
MQTREEHGQDLLALAKGRTMTHEAPYPVILESLVQRLFYRKGWKFRLADVDRGQGSKGLTLIITVTADDSYPPHDPIRVSHYMLVPAASYDARSWQWWLFQQCQLVDQHEAMECFTIYDAPGSENFVKPYAPLHGPGNDPYMVTETATDLDRRTAFTGEVR